MITFAGQEITSLSPDRVNRSGIAIVPEGRRIFPNLSVLENLMLGQRDGGWPLDEIYQLFPKLRMRQDDPRRESQRRRATDARDRARIVRAAEN